MSETCPHLIFERFSYALGARCAYIMKQLFPVPKPDTKRIVTFANHVRAWCQRVPATRTLLCTSCCSCCACHAYPHPLLRTDRTSIPTPAFAACMAERAGAPMSAVMIVCSAPARVTHTHQA